MELVWVQKIRATLFHFCISLFFLVLPLVGGTYYFYPDVFFWVDGGFEAIKLAVLVDLVLGPGLTFFLYKKGKPGWKIDLCMIGALQIIGFAFGFYNMYSVRPVALIFDQNAVFSVAKSQVKQSELNAFIKNNNPDFKGGVVMGYVDLPKDMKERGALAIDIGKSGRPFYVYPSLWNSKEEILNQSGFCLKKDHVQRIKIPEGRVIAENFFKLNPGTTCLVMGSFRFGQVLISWSEKEGLLLDHFVKAPLGHFITY